MCIKDNFNSKCDSVLDMDSFGAVYKERCHGKKSCNVSNIKSLIMPVTGDPCFDDDAVFFA